MTGSDMWHFIYVLKAILFNRGEKATRDLLIEVIFQTLNLFIFIVTKNKRIKYSKARHNQKPDRTKIKIVI